jgi:DNA-binding NarL/FixJ family response regulator
VVDPLVVEAVLRRHGRGEDSPLGRLTERERDVLEQMAAGRRNSAIAGTLCLSPSAVKEHITGIFSKLGVSEEASSHRRVAAVLTFLADR